MAAHPLDRYAGSWALTTGSAREEGLGYAFARQLAARRINIVLVDILADELSVRAAELQSTHGVSVRTIAVDLAQLESISSVQDELGDIDVDIVVCNHMYTPTDTPPILDMDLDVHNRMIDITARAYVNLIYRFGQLMRERHRGAIVIVSSGAGLMGMSYTGPIPPTRPSRSRSARRSGMNCDPAVSMFWW